MQMDFPYALDGSFVLEDVESILLRRKPIGISDCCSLYDHLIRCDSTVNPHTGLEPRWRATGHTVADGLTKNKSEPIDLLRSVVRAAKYQLADEQLVLDRKKAEKEHRKLRGTPVSRSQWNFLRWSCK